MSTAHHDHLPSRSYTVLLILGLALLTTAIYWPVHTFGFVDFDDGVYVQFNAHVQEGLTSRSLHYAFTESFGGWSPLVWISFLLDRELFGANPAAMHVENVALHTLGGILLWVFLSSATGSYRRSYVVAALFLCHPMHVESVAWISERKDVLSTPLLFGAMLASCRYCKMPGGWPRTTAYFAMILLLMLSLMAKAMGITFPILLLLLDYWPLNRVTAPSIKNGAVGPLLLEKLPVFAISTVFAAIAVVAQRAMGATVAVARLGIIDRIENAVACYVIYIVKLAVPTNLAAMYPHPGSRPIEVALAAVCLLGLVTWFAARLRRRAPYLIVGWLWFLIALLPVIGLVQIGDQAMADRYGYLPSIGLFIAVVWGSCEILFRDKPPLRVTAYAAPIILLMGLAWLSIIARRQVNYWRDTSSLFTHALNVAGPAAKTYLPLGRVAFERGDLHGAVDYFESVLQMQPGNSEAYNGLGNCWLAADPRKAIGFYTKATELAPSNAIWHANLSLAFLRINNLSAAAAETDRALSLDPQLPAAQAAATALHASRVRRGDSRNGDRLNR